MTPVQVALLAATVANGGTLYRPHLIRRVTDSGGAVVRQYGARPERSVRLDPANLAAVKEGLWGVVNEPGGTGVLGARPGALRGGEDRDGAGRGHASRDGRAP